jgi:hypothetical protein
MSADPADAALCCRQDPIFRTELHENRQDFAES